MSISPRYLRVNGGSFDMHHLFAFALAGWQKVAAITLVTSIGVTGAVVQVARSDDPSARTQGLDVRSPYSVGDRSKAASDPNEASDRADVGSSLSDSSPGAGVVLPPVELPTVSPPPVPTGLPDVVPIPKPAPSAVEGPGFCEGVDHMLDKTRASRRAGADKAHQGSYDGRLGEFLPIDSPYESWQAAYQGEVTAFDVTHGTRQYRETAPMFDQHGFTGGYDRGWQGKGAASTGGEGAVEFFSYEFASTDEALAFQEKSMRNACQEAKNTFTIPDMPSAVGLSLRYSSPEAQEEVSFVLGPRVYFVELYQDRHDEGYHRIVELARVGKKVAR